MTLRTAELMPSAPTTKSNLARVPSDNTTSGSSPGPPTETTVVAYRARARSALASPDISPPRNPQIRRVPPICRTQIVLLDRITRQIGMHNPLQYNPALDDDPVQPDPAQGQNRIARQHQTKPARKRRILDLDDDRRDLEALQRGRQREPSKASPTIRTRGRSGTVRTPVTAARRGIGSTVPVLHQMNLFGHPDNRQRLRAKQASGQGHPTAPDNAANATSSRGHNRGWRGSPALHVTRSNCRMSARSTTQSPNGPEPAGGRRRCSRSRSFADQIGMKRRALQVSQWRTMSATTRTRTWGAARPAAWRLCAREASSAARSNSPL
jgi:hypothetical protein